MNKIEKLILMLAIAIPIGLLIAFTSISHH